MISRFFSSWCGHTMFNLTEVFTFLVLGMISDFWLCYRYLEYDCILDHIPDFFGGSLLLCCCYNTRWVCMCFFNFLLSTPDTALAKMECWLPPPTCRWVRRKFSFPHCMLSPSQWNCDTNLQLFQSKIILSSCITENIISH